MYQQTPEQLTPFQKAQKFFKIIEAGDIALFNTFPQAIAMFGYTKVGKTSSCHILCDSPLCVKQIRGDLVFEPTSKKYHTAKIGFTTESETQIPNIFQTFLKEKDPKDNKYKFIKQNGQNKKIYLLDQPGHGDTYGFNRIFSNGYFHYRTFSKTPKLKFILAVSRQDLSGTAQKFKKTISNFISTFKDWDKVKSDVLKATSLLITKADFKTNIQNLKAIIVSLKTSCAGMGKTQKSQYQQIIDEFLNKNKVYFIEKPKDIHSRPVDNNTLHQIYANSQFWSRTENKNVADMSEINFEVSSEIMKQLRDKKKELFRQQFITFMKLMEERKNDVIVKHEASLANVIKTLQKDSVSANQQHDFLQIMKSLVKDFYKFQKSYDKERQKLQVNLFKAPQSEKWAQSNIKETEKEIKNIYFLKKFNVLEFLKQTSIKFLDIFQGVQRTVQSLEDYTDMFQSIFKKMSILRTDPKDTILYKYSYIIQRIIQQNKILTLILFSHSVIKSQINQIPNIPNDISSQDIFFTIQDKFINQFLSQIDLCGLKKQFIQKIDYQSTITSINPQVIDFFQSVKTNDEEGRSTWFKIAQMIIQYSKNIFKNNRKPEKHESEFAVCKLYKYRNQLYSFYEQLKKQNQDIEVQQQVIQTIFCLTKSLAQLLLASDLLPFWKQTRQCYRSINNASMIFEIYEQEIKSLGSDHQAQRKLYMEYANQASLYQRRQLAIQCAQKAYSLSNKYSQLKQTSKLIVNISTEKEFEEIDENSDGEDNHQETTYLKRLQRQIFCIDFSKELRETIQLNFPVA